MDVKIGCDSCGKPSAVVDTLQLHLDDPDFHNWDIDILCVCPNPKCGHVGRISLQKLVKRVMEGYEEPPPASPPTKPITVTEDDDGC